MKKEKGFTLIELLAVIVILAIIALIAMPLIMNIIKDVKKGAFIDSSYGIIKAAEQGHASELINENEVELTQYKYENGILVLKQGNIPINYKGSSPTSGTILINSDGGIALAFYKEGICITKGYSDTEIFVEEKDENECVINGDDNIIEKPSLNISDIDGNNGWYKSYPIVTSSASGIEYSISKDGETYSDWIYTDSNSFVVEEEGSNISVKVRVKQGNKYSEESYLSSLKIDVTAPDSITFIVNNLNNNSFTIDVAEAIDSTSGINNYEFYVNNNLVGNSSSKTYDVKSLNQTTTYSVYVKAIDKAGNVTTASTSQVTTKTLYYLWNKYNLVTSYSSYYSTLYSTTNTLTEQYYNSTVSCAVKYTINTSTGVVTLSDYIFPQPQTSTGRYVKRSGKIYKITSATYIAYNTYRVILTEYVSKPITTSISYSKGTISYGQVKGTTSSLYPNNNYLNGYWYVSAGTIVE
ncbi:MAG: prepilin-type N-terminal cleavage/methylation domain-containing protein [Bacilli bacterium]|nr:prepilin-type N-terminal cleavage/methylation domain-containing protein [Bacilli bacterium]